MCVWKRLTCTPIYPYTYVDIFYSPCSYPHSLRPVMLGLGLGLRPQNVGLGLGLGLGGCGLGLGLGLGVVALALALRPWP